MLNTASRGTKYIPGDVVYWTAVPARTDAWRGGNSIYLGNMGDEGKEFFFGHPIGKKDFAAYLLQEANDKLPAGMPKTEKIDLSSARFPLPKDFPASR